jgi:DNA adenine methylase
MASAHMQQLALFDEGHDIESTRIVNVASVPQRSPFRYPGGKTWLVPRLRQWLMSLEMQPSLFIEPFAGGGSIGLTVAFERLADHIIMVELDKQVAAVWHTILEGDGEWLADALVSFQLTPHTVAEALGKADSTLSKRERAFNTLLKNRVNRGGILAPGAGLVKHGENGRGLASRWYPSTLKRRILDIVTIHDRITFIEGDGLEIMPSHAAEQDVAFFIDPPYTAAGKKAGSRLYNCSQLNHNELFKLAASLQGHFLMTYDDTEEVRDLARNHGFAVGVVAMKNTHHAKMTELLISRDMSWLNL